MPVTKTKTADVIVAEVEVRGGVHVRATSPGIVRLAPGQGLNLRVRYDFEEASKDREHLEVTLESVIGTESQPPVVMTIKDRRMLSDSRFGIMEQTYRSLPAGQHSASVQVVAQYTKSAWDGSGQPRVQRDVAVGRFTATVE